MNRSLVICNGTVYTYEAIRSRLSHFPDFEHTVTVDGGIAHARKLKIHVDIALGDFDSISKENLSYIKKNMISMETYPSDKDRTDTEIAIDHCIKKGCQSITVMAFNGTRLDHSLANILMFASKSNKASITLVNEHNIAHYVHDCITLHAAKGQYVSILPLTDELVIKETKGLHYALHNTILRRGETVGVSNYPVEPVQSVTVSHGTALITVSED